VLTTCMRRCPQHSVTRKLTRRRERSSRGASGALEARALRDVWLGAPLAESEVAVVAEVWRPCFQGALRSQLLAGAGAMRETRNGGTLLTSGGGVEAQAQPAVLGSEPRPASYETRSEPRTGFMLTVTRSRNAP
jgi:hypothetical protein